MSRNYEDCDPNPIIDPDVKAYIDERINVVNGKLNDAANAMDDSLSAHQESIKKNETALGELSGKFNEAEIKISELLDQNKVLKEALEKLAKKVDETTSEPAPESAPAPEPAPAPVKAEAPKSTSTLSDYDKAHPTPDKSVIGWRALCKDGKPVDRLTREEAVIAAQTQYGLPVECVFEMKFWQLPNGKLTDKLTASEMEALEN